MCVAEQKFLTSFFHFQKPPMEDQTSGSQVSRTQTHTHTRTCTHCCLHALTTAGGGGGGGGGRGGGGSRLLLPADAAADSSAARSPRGGRWPAGAAGSAVPDSPARDRGLHPVRGAAGQLVSLCHCLCCSASAEWMLSLSLSLSLSLCSNSLYLLTTISHRLVVSADSGAMMSELDQTLKKALVCVRRLFDSFTVPNVTTWEGYIHAAVYCMQ